MKTTQQTVVIVGASLAGAKAASCSSAPSRSVPTSARRCRSAARAIGRRSTSTRRASTREVHADHGVEMLLGTGVEAFEGQDTVSAVRTGDDMEYSGYAARWDEVVFRGDPATRELIAFWLADGHVLAGMNVNVWDVTEHIQALIRARRPIDRGRLADPDVPLDELLPVQARTP